MTIKTLIRTGATEIPAEFGYLPAIGHHIAVDNGADRLALLVREVVWPLRIVDQENPMHVDIGIDEDVAVVLQCDEVQGINPLVGVFTPPLDVGLDTLGSDHVVEEPEPTPKVASEEMQRRLSDEAGRFAGTLSRIALTSGPNSKLLWRAKDVIRGIAEAVIILAPDIQDHQKITALSDLVMEAWHDVIRARRPAVTDDIDDVAF